MPCEPIGDGYCMAKLVRVTRHDFKSVSYVQILVHSLRAQITEILIFFFFNINIMSKPNVPNKKKSIKKEGYIILSGIIGLFVIILILFLTTPIVDPFDFFIRIFALLGFYSISIATLLTPFLKQIYQAFGKPFLKIHHIFAAIGIACATLHPLVFAIDVMNPAVFIPDFSSWYKFWLLAGRPALILIYVSIVAVLIKKHIKKYWRAIHALMYIVLLMGLVHGIMIGTDFSNIGIQIIFNGLFIASILGFVYKRMQKAKMKKRKNKN
ncbi:MAG: hypothetical protein GF364_19460 [Candidatus Lokiarchaeota archaeon]|nr:hypothetical protein [Candidatus Lokiarchaeota archaeon]